MKTDFTNKIKAINTPQHEDVPSTDTTPIKQEGATGDNPFKIANKIEDTHKKKPVQLYMDSELLKRLNKASKDKKYSRNEFINIIVSTFLDNMD